jgi:phage tail protein X
MNQANAFLHHIINTPSIQTDMQARLMTGEALETVVLDTAHDLGYAVTFADLTAVLDANPVLANQIAMLLPAPMLELDDTHLQMIAGGSNPEGCSTQDCYPKA